MVSRTWVRLTTSVAEPTKCSVMFRDSVKCTKKALFFVKNAELTLYKICGRLRLKACRQEHLFDVPDGYLLGGIKF